MKFRIPRKLKKQMKKNGVWWMLPRLKPRSNGYSVLARRSIIDDKIILTKKNNVR